MEKTLWEKLLYATEKLYYTNIFLFFCTLIALAFYIKYYRKELVYNIFGLYIIGSLILINLLFQVIQFSLFQKGLKLVIFLEASNTLFSLLELITFLTLFKNILKTKKTNQLILILEVFFIFLCSFFFIFSLNKDVTREEIKKISYFINITEFLILLSICLFYFYRLLAKENTQVQPICKSPSLWISSGLFFYCTVSLPFLFIAEILFANSKTFYFVIGSIHYLSFSLLFLCLVKAFSCRTPLTA